MKLEEDQKLVISDGKFVVYDVGSGFFGALRPFHTRPLEVKLKRFINCYDESCLAVSNDRKLAVSYVIDRMTERRKLRSHPYKRHDDVRKLMMRTYHFGDETKIIEKELKFGGELMVIEHGAISPNNNLIALVYSVYEGWMWCKIFKLTKNGNYKVFRTFDYRVESEDFGLFFSSFNSSEDLYFLRMVDGDGTNGMFVYDINKRKTIDVPFDPDFAFMQAEILSTPKQDLGCVVIDKY